MGQDSPVGQSCWVAIVVGRFSAPGTLVSIMRFARLSMKNSKGRLVVTSLYIEGLLTPLTLVRWEMIGTFGFWKLSATPEFGAFS